MGQAELRGTPEQRKQKAIDEGRGRPDKPIYTPALRLNHLDAFEMMSVLLGAEAVRKLRDTHAL